LCGRTRTYIGSAPFLAPEIALHLEYSLPADWYSAGILLFELLTGSHEPCHRLLMEMSVDNPARWVAAVQETLSLVSAVAGSGDKTISLVHYQAAQDLLSHLLEFDPGNRWGFWTLPQIENHAFFTEAGVQWSAVYSGTSAPPLPDFDRRLGHVDDAEPWSGSENDSPYDQGGYITLEDQDLFKGH
jgi:serine/threonine protein kinase